MVFDFDGAHQNVLDYYHSRGMDWGGRGYGTKPAILIIDMAYGWTDPVYPGGSLRVSEAVDWIAKLLETARPLNVPIIYTTPPRPYTLWSDCQADEAQKAALAEANRHSRIDDRITPAPDDKVIYKVGSSAFFNTDLYHYLSTHGIDTLLITGCVTSCCVRASVVDADNYGLKNILVRPCINDRSETEHEWHIRDLTRFGKLVEIEEVTDYLKRLEHS
jgi:maleamate amidohydrolase